MGNMPQKPPQKPKQSYRMTRPDTKMCVGCKKKPKAEGSSFCCDKCERQWLEHMYGPQESTDSGDTIVNEAGTIKGGGPFNPQDAGPATTSFTGQSPGGITPAEMLNIAKTREGLQQQNIQNMSLDQKLNLVLQKSAEAEKVAYAAAKSVSGFEQRLDRAFNDLSGMIKKLAGGKSLEEPGSSIWGEDDDTVQY
jgi:hypothetical protein